MQNCFQKRLIGGVKAMYTGVIIVALKDHCSGVTGKVDVIFGLNGMEWKGLIYLIVRLACF